MHSSHKSWTATLWPWEKPAEKAPQSENPVICSRWCHSSSNQVSTKFLNHLSLSSTQVRAQRELRLNLLQLRMIFRVLLTYWICLLTYSWVPLIRLNVGLAFIKVFCSYRDQFTLCSFTLECKDMQGTLCTSHCRKMMYFPGVSPARQT